MDQITFVIRGMLNREEIVEGILVANVRRHVGNEVDVSFVYEEGKKAGVTTLIVKPSSPELANERLITALKGLPSFQEVIED